MSSAAHTGSSSMIIRCEGCDKAYKIYPEKLPSGVSSFPCRACGTIVPIPHSPAAEDMAGKSGRVLVAVEEEELGKLIQRILAGDGFDGHLSVSGDDALRALQNGGWDLLLVSVYLPDMMGYELLDQVKSEPTSSKVPSILLSSIHHAARYKRAPTSLYGADDYLERHHLPDLLVPKVRRLLQPDHDSLPKVTPGDVPPPTDNQVQARRDLETVEKISPPPEDSRMGEIQRMCRVIAGDIALYNEDVIKSSSPDSLLESISGDLTEGEALLMSRFPDMEDQISHLLRAEMLRLLVSRGVQV